MKDTIESFKKKLAREANPELKNLRKKLNSVADELLLAPRCRHCGKPMLFKCEGKTCYLFICENNDCEAWHNAVEVSKTKLAEKLAREQALRGEL